jgi:hypothetical protein
VSELENALRKALAKGDASNPAFRERVYRAAASAMERKIAESGDISLEAEAERKQQLSEAVARIEADFPQAADEPAPPVEAEPSTPAPEDVLPVVRGDTRGPVADVPELKAEPRESAVGSADAPLVDRGPRPKPEKSAKTAQKKDSPKRRAPFALLLSAIVLLGLLVIGGWWAATTGLFMSAEERDTSVPNPPLRLENESFEGTAPSGSSSAPARISGSPDEQGWITLFDPSDPTTLTLSGAASATIDGDPSGAFAVIVSPDAASTIGVDVPPGTLRTLAGKVAQFSIVARSEDDAPTEMSVTCGFAELGDCGRLRFSATQSDNEFLFRIELPDTSVSGAGRLNITTDLDNSGKAVKLSSVRVRELGP